MGRRFAVHAGTRKALILLLVLASSAVASPKKVEAKVEFDRGVAAYKKGDYATAADALGSSFALEPDEETLFAWAQTERKLGRCDKAIELYTKLLSFKLPAANKKAVDVQISECKTIVAEEKRKLAAEEKRKLAEEKRKPPPSEPAPAPAPVSEPPPQQPPPPSEEPAPRDEPTTRAWWKDPVGGALVGAGVVGIGVGVVFLVQGSAADAEKDRATTYDDFVAAADRAESLGRIGVIATAVGGALVAGGIVWYVTRKPSRERTAWIVPTGTGIALGGSF